MPDKADKPSILEIQIVYKTRSSKSIKIALWRALAPIVLMGQMYRTVPIVVAPDTLYSQNEADLAFDDSGNIGLVWGSREIGGSGGGHLSMKVVYSDGGQLAEMDDVSGSMLFVQDSKPQIIATDSYIAVVWTNDRGFTESTSLGIYDYQNGAIIKAWRANQGAGLEIAITRQTDSTVYFVRVEEGWPDKIVGSSVILFDDDTYVPPTRLDDSPPAGYGKITPKIFSQANDSLKVVLWQDNRAGQYQYQAFARNILPDGTPVGIGKLVSGNITEPGPGALQYAGAPDNASNLHVVWSTYKAGITNLYYQQLDRGLDYVGPIVRVNNIENLSLKFVGVDIATTSDKVAALVVWSDDRTGIARIYGQWFSVGGQKVGSNFPLSPLDTVNHVLPTIAIKDGILAVAWSAGLYYSSNPNLVLQMATFNIDDILDYDPQASIPAVFTLHHAYPNPFNPTTTIRYELPEPANVRLIVYNLLGREVIRLVNTNMNAGFHNALWNGQDSAGKPVPSGLYIARMVTPKYTKAVKMVLLK